jgi:hypothetical protein
MVIWYFWSFGVFCGQLVYRYFPILVFYVKKNLATLRNFTHCGHSDYSGLTAAAAAMPTSPP